MTSNQPIDVDSLRLELSDYARRSFYRGLICGTGGNLSVRVPGTDSINQLSVLTKTNTLSSTDYCSLE